MGVRIQELPETTGINKEDVLIVEDGQGTKKGTVQKLDEALGVSQLKEDLDDLFIKGKNLIDTSICFGEGTKNVDSITGEVIDGAYSVYGYYKLNVG